MDDKNLDMEHKEQTWDIFIKLSQWTVGLTTLALILMAFFLV